MIEKLLHQPGYSELALMMYYSGAFFWLLAYVIAVYKIQKDKFLEFPAIVIAVNVPWEFLFGFVFDLDFGGPILLWSWRAGLLMDLYMLYAAFKYGSSQTDIPFMKRYMPFFLMFAFLVSLGGVYTFVKSGYEIQMGFNSAMILNIMESALCLLFLARRPDVKFSTLIGFARFVATDVFFFLFIYMSKPDAYFAMFTCMVCAVIDIIYIVLCFKQNQRLAKG
jgi:hypothetical protein